MTLPTKALSVMIMPVSFENNFAFRMELYGCEPGKWPIWNCCFVVFLLGKEVPKIWREEVEGPAGEGGLEM